MKRGKDDEKIMGPMFPRLHVNDTEKGGPRAPPRNKMALYEQLTIPSQRHNTGAVPSKQNNSSSSSLVPSTSTSQGTSRDRNMYFPLYQPPSAPVYEEIQVHSNEPGNSGGQQVRVDNKRKAPEEDDFMVPIFSQARSEVLNGKTQSTLYAEKHSYLSLNHQAELPTTIGEEANQSTVGSFLSKQLIKDQDRRNLRVFDSPKRCYSEISMRGSDDVQQKNVAFVSREHQDQHRCSAFEELETCLQEDQDSLPGADARYDEDVPNLAGKENLCQDTNLRLRPNPQAGYGYKGDNRIMRTDDDHLQEKENIDRGDDVSETSMVDSAFAFDITPDDVVDVIGRKHFWKARTAIVNQQRVFAIQVFELHRLLKVQKLIAGSPDLLLETMAFVGKSTLKGSAVKNYSSEYAEKPLPQKLMQKVVAHKVTDKVEGTAENAVPKAPTPAPCQQNPMQPVGYKPLSTNGASSPLASTDPNVNPWGFHQPAAHQWLVPVMSPSEGLVYKPYPAPGFMGPVCGGCGPVGPTHVVGNMMNPPYGVATPQHQQGMGMPPAIQFGGQGYFPPYGMQMISPSMSGSTVEQLNKFSGSNPYSQMSQPAGASTSPRAQRQNKLNVLSQENGPNASAAKPQVPKEREFQGSSASSPSDRVQGTRVDPPSERRDTLPLFRAPSTSGVPEADNAPPGENQAKVIRVVPHRSTRESAARIFQSIQEERQHYGSS